MSTMPKINKILLLILIFACALGAFVGCAPAEEIIMDGGGIKWTPRKYVDGGMPIQEAKELFMEGFNPIFPNTLGSEISKCSSYLDFRAPYDYYLELNSSLDDTGDGRKKCLMPTRLQLLTQ